MAVRIGDSGTAMTALRPQGVVRIGGTRHDARSEGGYVETGSEVVVVGGDNTGLIVRRVEPGPAVALPNHGREVYGSFGARVAAEGAREDAERARWESARRRYGFVVGSLFGALAGGGGTAQLWGPIVERAGAPWAVAALAAVGGAAWGACLFRGLDARLRELGGDYWRFTTASTGLGLTGGALVAAWGVPAVGLGLGLAGAIGATLAFAVIPPALGMLFEWVAGGED
ncbi:hypothetical protein GobsT_72090 [Gemmata obscuriglobus]|uniref:NfeD-like C-terminal domain-containing protein n=1 Tax=Gemmata obscuriglobus TaxID=114 RepID=A0A2Z3HJS9_9BACT|nr:NfeD family protein [Gemmata obscuriglobus]AWM41700.1 hypothetical protein C1280_35035 [Gemmata obscuriglobus]QEG32354.1 hypothetical protein GobsT_72090 [Gemmata obscuriglobus]VTS11710.1 unnamed protein product [Gemmata obscuriglobus UQM 2246]